MQNNESNVKCYNKYSKDNSVSKKGGYRYGSMELDCGNMDIRYDEKEKSYYCNNCGSRNIGTRKEGCKYMLGNGLCGKNPACTSFRECEAPCSYYEK